MKKIVSVRSSAEGHLVVEALKQEGIAASVQGEFGVIGSVESPSVWVDNDEDADRAIALVAEVTAKPPPAPTRRSPAFVVGLGVGILLGFVILGILRGGPAKNLGASPDSWDTNNDRKVDGWGRYDATGRLVESIDDLNFDGTPDSWTTYDPPGVVSTVRGDEDFDGREDLWERYQKGVRASYTADNDRNGVVDEWGRFEHGRTVERNWSFSNDKVVDKRAFYRAGRKIREEYDRNRDGVFEEIVQFDEFERVVGQR
jgi:hypothetical protein